MFGVGLATVAQKRYPAAMQDEWYKNWFDTPYYAMLYQHRDYREAQLLIDNLVHNVQLPAGGKVLDLACGSGRHAIYFNELGFDVTGVDLSRNKIAQARTQENSTLRFVVGDMRALDLPDKYDLVTNLFTSMGYFADVNDNLLVFESVHNVLADEGTFVLDYLNATWIEKNLSPHATHDVEGVHFEIRKRIVDGVVEKAIRIKDGPKMLHFTEHVALLHLREFERMLKRAHLRIEHTWGDYTGAPFDEQTSKRLLLFVKKA